RVGAAHQDGRRVERRAVAFGCDGGGGQSVVELLLGCRRRVGEKPLARVREAADELLRACLAEDVGAWERLAEGARPEVNVNDDRDRRRDERLPTVGGDDESVPGGLVL